MAAVEGDATFQEEVMAALIFPVAKPKCIAV
jgi:hypothetical protein